MRLTIKQKFYSQEPEVSFELQRQDDGSLRLLGFNDQFSGMVLLTIATNGEVRSVCNGFEPLGLKFQG